MNVENMKVIRVELGERSYEIVMKSGLLAEAGTLIGARLRGRRCLIVTDRNVGPLYGRTLASTMQKSGFDGSAAELPPGEGAKSLQVAEFLYDRCLDANLDRESVLIAVGGGVMGDLTGFVAATFYRGIAFVQVPTTLLAMVDAAIGGKTGVDLPRAKNAVGAFHQPKLVIIDPSTLQTLPERELKAGLAEVVKYGIIDDAALFAFIEQNADKLLSKQPQALTEVIEKSAGIKARIVSQDEREQGQGPRALLNLGHTFAHALESATDYKGYLHGEAVAIGTLLAAEVAVAQQMFTRADCERVGALLQRLGLPTKLKPGDPDVETLYAAMFKDKKVASGKLRFILPEQIGKCRVLTDVPAEAVKKAWQSARE